MKYRDRNRVMSREDFLTASKKEFRGCGAELIVTRHKGLVEWLISNHIVSASVPVIEHATVADVKGKHVIGVLPISLAVHAASVTEVALQLPAEMRGTDLTASDVESLACGIKTYSVQACQTPASTAVLPEIDGFRLEPNGYFSQSGPARLVGEIRARALLDADGLTGLKNALNKKERELNEE